MKKLEHTDKQKPIFGVNIYLFLIELEMPPW